MFFLSRTADLDIKPINKRASGQAFEVILKPTSPVSDSAHCITSPPKRDVSLEDIMKKLDAAEDRRRVRMLPGSGYLVRETKRSANTKKLSNEESCCNSLPLLSLCFI